MSSVIVRDMTAEDEYFVSACSHVNESAETDAYAKKRLAWLKARAAKGERVKVALLDGRHAGFLYLTPVEMSPIGPLGRDLTAIPCLFVEWESQKKHGIGRALVQAAEDETKRQGRKGITTIAYYNDFWFMPGAFFEKTGFVPVERRDDRAVMWKPFDKAAEEPRFFTPDCRYEPIPGKVVIDVFWMTFCGVEDNDLVRKIASEFHGVVVRDHCNDDMAVLRRHQIPRGLYINGREVEYDWEDREAGLRRAIGAAVG